MRIPRALGFRLALAAVEVVLLLWLRHSLLFHKRPPANQPILDRSVTSPLNQPGGGTAPAEPYEIYSALYQAPNQEPLSFPTAATTATPPIHLRCPKPSTPQQ